MSFILDALRKAEDGRQPRPADNIAIEAQSVSAPPPNLRRRFALGFAILGGTAAIVTAAAWVKRPAPQSDVAQPTQGAAPASTAAVRTPAQTVVRPASPLASREPVRDLDREIVRAAPRPREQAPSAAMPARRGSVVIEGQADAADKSTPRTASAAPPAAPAGDSARLPEYENLLRQGRINLPNISLDMHVYNRDPARRFVFVNMKKYREGERITDNTSIEEIVPRGAVLNHSGIRFLLKPD